MGIQQTNLVDLMHAACNARPSPACRLRASAVVGDTGSLLGVCFDRACNPL